MDVPRGKEVARRKLIRRIVYIALLVPATPLITPGLPRLKRAAPSVDRATVWTDTVKRGPMLREVRGLGTLVPVTIRLIPAITDGTVETRFLLPGTLVKADTVILDMRNPELQQAALDAEYQLRGAEASLNNMKAQLQNQLMDKRAQAAAIRSAYHTAALQKANNEKLYSLGLVADVIVKTSEVQAEELEKQNELAEKQVQTFADSIAAQIAVQQANVD